MTVFSVFDLNSGGVFLAKIPGGLGTHREFFMRASLS